MSQKKYHAAIEVKSITAYYLRRISDLENIVDEAEDCDLTRFFHESEQKCRELLAKASEMAEANRIETPIPDHADRGIDEFLGDSSNDCDDCDGSCGGCKS